MGRTQPSIAIPRERSPETGRIGALAWRRVGYRMNGRVLRIACAIVLAILGAFWFEVDFSSSHQVAHPAIIAYVADGGTATTPSHPLPSLSALGSALTGGVVTALPPWGVLAVASAYLLGRLAYKRRSLRR